MIVSVCLENGFITLKMEMHVKMIYLRMGPFTKFLAKKFLSHNFFVDLQMYDAFLKKRTWSPNIGRCKTLV